MAKLTKKSWDRYASKQAGIRKRARDEVEGYVLDEGADVELAATVAKSLKSAQKWGRSAAAFAATWYDQAASAADAGVPKAEVAQPYMKAKRIRDAEQDAAERYLASGNVDAFARACGTAVACEVKRAASQTILKNAARDGAEFAWIPGGDETCAFCMALSSQGWRSASKAVKEGDHADHIHDNCECEFAVRFDKSTTIEGFDEKAAEYRETYYAADGRSSKDKINSMRRDMYAERKDAINERRRELYAEKKAAEGGA